MTATNEWKAKILRDQRSTEELITDALAATDELKYHQAALVLQVRADVESMQAAVRLCRSGSAPERQLGACVLGQIGDYKAFPVECRTELVRMLTEETHCDVLQDVCVALGHRRESAGVPGLARLSSHPSPEVRYAVVHGLLHSADLWGLL